jgi:hypothetical protein
MATTEAEIDGRLIGLQVTYQVQLMQLHKKQTERRKKKV